MTEKPDQRFVADAMSSYDPAHTIHVGSSDGATLAAQVTWQKGELKRLKEVERCHKLEVKQFNDGFHSVASGDPRPDYEEDMDHWTVGKAWGRYDLLQEEIERLKTFVAAVRIMRSATRVCDGRFGDHRWPSEVTVDELLEALAEPQPATEDAR